MTQTANVKKVKCDFSNTDLYNRVYIPLFYKNVRNLHLFGSAGSGKSRFGCQKEVVLSYDWNRKNRRTLVVRKVYNTLANSVYSELKTVIYEWGIHENFDILKSPLSIKNKLTGVEFIFAGLDDIEKIKSISGVDRILIEEATELSNRSELDQLNLRLRGFEEVQITLMYNPINVHHWLNKQIHESLPGDHFIFKTTYKDNEKLLAKDPNYALSIESLKDSNPNYYKVYGLGEWGQDQEGLIYPEYQSVPDMPPVKYYGLDFGYNDPCALVAVSIADTPNQSKKDLYWQELLYESKHTSSTLIKRFDEIGVDKNILINADNSRPEMIEDIRKAGYSIQPCEKYKGSVVEGITEVKKYNLKIVAGSKNTFKEIENYTWKEKNGIYKDDEPNDSVNHAMDAGRYGTEAANQPVFEITDRERNIFGLIK